MKIHTENALFLMALHQVVLQDIKKSSHYGHLDVKIYGISPDSLLFSITVTALMLGQKLERMGYHMVKHWMKLKKRKFENWKKQSG